MIMKQVVVNQHKVDGHMVMFGGTMYRDANKNRHSVF